MERRLGWSRALCSTVLVLGIVVAIGVVLLVLAQAISDAVRGFSHDLPQIVDQVRHSDVGDFINGGSGSLDTLREHASDITKGAAKVSGGVADVGVSAFGAVTLFFSVIFLTLFGLIDEPRVRDWIGGLMYRDTRERYLRRHGPDHPRDLALHARQPRHLRDLRDRLRRHRRDPRSAVPARPGADRRVPRPHPDDRGDDRRAHHRGRRAVGQRRGADRLRDRDGGLPADRELRSAADDHREGGPRVGLHRARQRAGVRSAVRLHQARSSACRSRRGSRFSSRSSRRPGGLASRPPRSRKACDDGSHMSGRIIGRDNKPHPGGNHERTHRNIAIRTTVHPVPARQRCARPPATGGSCWPPESRGSPSRWSFFSSTRRP